MTNLGRNSAEMPCLPAPPLFTTTPQSHHQRERPSTQDELPSHPHPLQRLEGKRMQAASYVLPGSTNLSLPHHRERALAPQQDPESYGDALLLPFLPPNADSCPKDTPRADVRGTSMEKILEIKRFRSHFISPKPWRCLASAKHAAQDQGSQSL